jgi:hypothetical protein
MNAPLPHIDILKQADAEALLKDVVVRLKAGQVVPFLGPAVSEQSGAPVPMNPEALAAFFGTKVARALDMHAPPFHRDGADGGGVRSPRRADAVAAVPRIAAAADDR